MPIILTMLDGSLPWSMNEWFMDNFWCAFVGYSDVLNRSWTYEFYRGNDVEGEHTFTFQYGK
jgi:hypothetical protein